MTEEELREEIESNTRCELEERLQGDCMCDFITKEEMCDILDDFDEWASTANIGDSYVYDGESFTLVFCEEEYFAL